MNVILQQGFNTSGQVSQPYFDGIHALLWMYSNGIQAVFVIPIPYSFNTTSELLCLHNTILLKYQVVIMLEYLGVPLRYFFSTSSRVLCPAPSANKSKGTICSMWWKGLQSLNAIHPAVCDATTWFANNAKVRWRTLHQMHHWVINTIASYIKLGRAHYCQTLYTQ